MNPKQKPKPQPKDWQDESFEEFIRKVDPAYRKKK